MKNVKRQSNIEESVEELFQSLQETKNLRVRDKLRELQPKWEQAKAKRWDELTDDERREQAKEQAEAEREDIREQELFKIKQVFQTIIDSKSDDPNSNLFTTAEELLEFVVKYESEPSSVSNYEWNRFESVLLTRFESLFKAEIKVEQEQSDREAGTEQNNIFAKIWAMFCKLYEITLRVIVDAFLDRWRPKSQ